MVQGRNPFYKSKGPEVTDSPYKEKVSVKRFLAGSKKIAKSTGRGLKVAGKGVVAGTRATIKGGVALGQVSTSARKKLYEKRALGLERRQNISTYKANIAAQRQLAIQQKTVVQEAKLKQLELKQARRDFLKSQRQQRIAESRAKAPFRDSSSRGHPLSDRSVKKTNGVSGKGGFFG